MITSFFTLIVCVLLVSAILVQNTKGNLQSRVATQIIGVSRSNRFIEKTTWGLAAVFMLLCLY